MRTRTKDQKFWLSKMAEFWADRKRGVKKPWRHQLGNDGSVEVQWINVDEGDRLGDFGPLLDFCEENEMRVKWGVLGDLREFKYIGRGRYTTKWSGHTALLTVYIPGGVPKRTKPARLSKSGEE